jgi:hypothetical protein
MAQTTRVWQTLTTTGTPGSWAVQMRVPVGTSGLDLGSSFRFFSYLRVTTGGTPAVWIHAWPRRSTPLPTSTAFGDPTSSAWETVELSASGVCQTGVSLVGWPDIGVNEGVVLPNGASADGSIRVTRTAPHPTNDFFARPLNNTGATIGAQALSASFRIANWGSVASPSAGSWMTIPTGADVRDPNPVVHGAKAKLDFAWQLTTVTDQALIDAFVGTPTSPPTRLDHQCVFVELSGPGLLFANRSAFRNMWIVNASSLVADAEISVAGLSPLPGATHRDTYIYVQAMNMPAVLDTPIVPPTEEGRGEERRGDVERRRSDRAGDESGIEARFGLEPAALGTSVVGPAPIVPIHERVPSYTVHVWHATGQTFTEDGVTRQLLEPQTSFGVLVDHKGALYGWDHSLKGAGLIEIAPNFYRLAVPEGGAARVTVTIEAHETPRPGNWFWWLEWLIRLIRRFIAWVRKLLGL